MSKTIASSAQAERVVEQQPAGPVPNGADDPYDLGQLQQGDRDQATDKPVDPFDLAELRDGQAFEDYGSEAVLLSVEVRKPGPKEFFRVHASPDFCITAPLYLHEAAMDRTYYWVAPSMRPVLNDELIWCRLYTCSSKIDPVFLWPCRLPKAGNSGRRWAETARRGAIAAMSEWGKLKASSEGGGYTWHKAKGQYPEPTWPAGKTLEDLIKLAFADSTICTQDHLIFKLLEGPA